MRNLRLAGWLCALLLVVSQAAAFAQQTTGTILGRVTDDQSAAIPGATVTATSPTTGFTRSAVSDAEGMYRLQALNVGEYNLLVELPGFSSVDRKGVIVNIGQSISLDFSLKVANLSLIHI